MATLNKESLAKKRQANLIERLKKKETLMKWGLIAAGIVILLLLLYIGYATDWMRGLKTTSSSQSVNPSLDAATTPAGDSQTSGETATSNQGTNTTNTGTTNTGPSTNTTTNNTTRETTNTTTNNTTTNNTTTPGESSLLDLYNDTNIGDSLDTVINRATSLGATVDCADVLLIRTCTTTLDDVQVQVRGLLTTGLVTSVLRTL